MAPGDGRGSVGPAFDGPNTAILPQPGSLSVRFATLEINSFPPLLWGSAALSFRNLILQAVKGDRATAETIFEDYLDGKLSEELLSISRGCVSADQAGSF
jgi:hypothetical protein